MKNFILNGYCENREKKQLHYLLCRNNNQVSFYILILQLKPSLSHLSKGEQNSNSFKLSENYILSYSNLNFFCKGISLDCHLNYTLILSPKNEKVELSQEWWLEWFHKLNESLTDSCNTMVKGILSESVSDMNLLPKAYEDTLQMAYQTLFIASGYLIFYETVKEYHKKYFVYPAEKEMWMSRALTAGDRVKTNKLIYEIVMSASEYSYDALIMTIFRLASALITIINELQKCNFLNIPNDVSERILSTYRVGRFYGIDEVVNTFQEAADNIVTILENKKHRQHNNLLETVHEYIQKNYYQYECCVETIADIVGMSPAYLGRLYKRYMRINISEEIYETRLRHSKEMLLDKKYTIAEIGQKNGFSSNSYFCKVFKKKFGITPQEYRNKNRLIKEP